MAFTGTARLFLSEDLPSYIKAHRELTYEPGSQATYRSVDTLLLGMVPEVGGEPISVSWRRTSGLRWARAGLGDLEPGSRGRHGKAFC